MCSTLYLQIMVSAWVCETCEMMVALGIVALIGTSQFDHRVSYPPSVWLTVWGAFLALHEMSATLMVN